MKKKMKSLLFLLTIFFVIFPFVPQASAEPLTDIRELIRDNYVDEVPASVLAKGSAKEIVRYLDVHSEYMTAREYEAFINDIENRFVGIGVVLEMDAKGVKVTSVIPKGPAEKAGIRTGDVITHVNGRSMAGKSVQAAASLITGLEKTAVTLTISRAGQAKPLTKKIVREAVALPNVESSMLGGNIGYIRLNSFSTESAAEISRAIRSLPKSEGWIFDLRDNGGGYITAAQDVTGFFPKANEAFQLRERNGEPSVFEAVVQPVQFSKPTHVLINENSASASEMVSGAVKEQKAATIYGRTSYGKGTMQSLFGFDDGSALKLTTARFYSPGGQPVDQIGVSPDVVTGKGKELAASHRNHLLAKIKGYKPLPELKNVPVTKKFTIEMNKKMDWNGFDKGAVRLIQLGGEESAIIVEVKNDKTITVTSKKNLVSETAYLLIIHPNWKDAQKNPMKQGVYLDITVN